MQDDVDFMDQLAKLHMMLSFGLIFLTALFRSIRLSKC